MPAEMELDRLGLGRLERLELRSVFGDNVPDLLPWFLQNLDIVSGVLGIEITPMQREIRVDGSPVNVLGSDPLGRPVIVENQIDPSSHSQLGQLIVHASSLDGAVVVWVASRFQPEHRRTLDWLNDRSDDKVDFFGVEMQLVRIGRSLPAPVLNLIAQPTDWRKWGRRYEPALPDLRLDIRSPLSPSRATTLLPDFRSGPAAEPRPEPLPAQPRADFRLEPSPPAPRSDFQLEPAPPAPADFRVEPPSQPRLEVRSEPRRSAEPPAEQRSADARSNHRSQGRGADASFQTAQMRHRFFEQMFEAVALRRPGFRIPKFGYENWVGFGAGPFGFYDVAFTNDSTVRAGVYLDMQERTATKRLFDDLMVERLTVETGVGRILSWERLDDRRASRIVDYREMRDPSDADEQRSTADWAADTVVRMMDALDSRLRSTAQILLARAQGN